MMRLQEENGNLKLQLQSLSDAYSLLKVTEEAAKHACSRLGEGA